MVKKKNHPSLFLKNGVRKNKMREIEKQLGLKKHLIIFFIILKSIYFIKIKYYKFLFMKILLLLFILKYKIK